MNLSGAVAALLDAPPARGANTFWSGVPGDLRQKTVTVTYLPEGDQPLFIRTDLLVDGQLTRQTVCLLATNEYGYRDVQYGVWTEWYRLPDNRVLQPLPYTN